MAIVLENQSDTTVEATTFTDEVNLTHSVNSASNLGLLVLVSFLNDVPETISSIYWDPEGANEELDYVIDYTTSDDSRVEAFYLHGPTPGASKNVEVIFSASPLDPTSVIVCAYTLSGVAQSGAVRQYDGQAGDITALTAVLSNAQSGDFLAGCAHVEAAFTNDWDSSTVTMTTVAEKTTQSSHSHAHGMADGTGETLICTFSGNDHSAGLGIAIMPVQTSYELTGITKDNAGSVLGSCHCFLCKDNGDNTCSYVNYQLSNASTGIYNFTGIGDNDAAYFVISWKDNTPHVMDVTDHVLQPMEE